MTNRGDYSNESKSVLVTGASGNVGREVVAAVQRHGLRVTAANYDVASVRTLFPPEVEVAHLDFMDPTTWADALAGHGYLFLMRPPAITDVENTLIPLVDTAKAQGIEHVVFLSVAGADKNRFVPHRKVEDHLRMCGVPFTNLRPGFFAQNLQSAYRQDIVEDNRIYVPAGRAPVNWIDVRDIAEVVALIFEDPTPHRNKDYTLAGPGPVPWKTVTSALSEVTGREIHYQPASVAGYALHLRRRGLSVGAILVQTILHFLLRFGQGASKEPTLEALIGRPGRTVQEYIHDHREVWRKQYA